MKNDLKKTAEFKPFSSPLLPRQPIKPRPLFPKDPLLNPFQELLVAQKKAEKMDKRLNFNITRQFNLKREPFQKLQRGKNEKENDFLNEKNEKIEDKTPIVEITFGNNENSPGFLNMEKNRGRNVRMEHRVSEFSRESGLIILF